MTSSSWHVRILILRPVSSWCSPNLRRRRAKVRLFVITQDVACYKRPSPLHDIPYDERLTRYIPKIEVKNGRDI
jgi:hypothetical protein